MNMDSRQMAMMMKRMGIQQRDIEGVQEIVIRTATKEYRFTRAAVSVMTAQGTETWQIQGKPTVRDLAPGASASGPTPARATTATTPALEADGSEESDSEGTIGSTASDVAYVPSKDDIQTVVDAARVSPDKAKAALLAAKGDLAQAIVDLQG